MQVILTSKVKNLGDIGDIVDVKNGYAKNFLIPRKKAVYNSKINHQNFLAQKEEIEKREKELLDQSMEIKVKFNNKELIIIENASDDGRLYGSVNAANIIIKFKELTNIAVSKSDIFIEKPIKEIGIYKIAIHLYADINLNILLIVTRNELEIEMLKNKSNAKKDENEEESKESSE